VVFRIPGFSQVAVTLQGTAGVHDGDLGTLAMHVHPDAHSHQSLLPKLVDPEA
jgi:hypothetical protein